MCHCVPVIVKQSIQLTGLNLALRRPTNFLVSMVYDNLYLIIMLTIFKRVLNNNADNF